MNGRLAVSRAIGDYGLKDVVIGEPDIACLTLNGNEDFLILACDGLWDYTGEDEVATKVYSALEKNNGKSSYFVFFGVCFFLSFLIIVTLKDWNLHIFENHQKHVGVHTIHIDGHWHWIYWYGGITSWKIPLA